MVGPAQWGVCIRTVFYIADTPALTYWNNNIATTSPTECDIIILDVLTGSQTAVFSGHTDKISSLTYSMDGTFLVSGSNDKTIKLWDVQTGGVIKTLCGHTGYIWSVSISADDTMIASTAKDRKICLWNIKTGNRSFIDTYRIDYTFTTVTFHPTNPQLLSTSCLGGVQQWKINGGNIGCKIGFPVSGWNTAFSPDGTQFVSLKGRTVTIRNIDSRMAVVEFNLVATACCCCFSLNGRLIAVAAECGIYLWDITGPDPCLIQTLTGHSGHVRSLVFSSLHTLISASYDKSIKFWQIGTSSADPVLPDSKSSSPTLAQIKSVSLQARDGLAFSIDEMGVMKTWDILAGCCKESYKTQIRDFTSADIQLISDRLIIVCGKNSMSEIHVWDAEKGKLKTMGKRMHTLDLRITMDGSRVLQLCRDSIRVWDIWAGKQMYKEKLKRENESFGPLRMDGSKVLVHSGESSIQSWDFGAPGSIPIQFSETSSGRPCLNFGWSKGSLARIEDSITGEEVFQLYGKYANPCAAQWDGQYLIAGYNSGDVLILDFSDALS